MYSIDGIIPAIKIKIKSTFFIINQHLTGLRIIFPFDFPFDRHGRFAVSLRTLSFYLKDSVTPANR
jgi:hypothetical protein